MGKRSSRIILVVALVVSACGGGSDTATTEEVEPTTAAPSATAEQESATDSAAQATSAAEEPATTATAAAAGSGATLTIGDETWSFDTVSLCAVPPADPATTSLILIAKQGDWQLIAEVIDATGAQSLEGDGVYDRISLQNNADPTQSWLANNEGAVEKFIVVDGNTITASTTFDAVTGLSDDTPGTLEADCS